MATNSSEMVATQTTSTNSAKSSGVEESSAKVVTFDNLASQERRTRIAFLENQQAELETEIRLLKQNGN